MICSIIAGSLIRATPPCTRMSAGTRSSAITATAPASSAILACSAVTTSMITPPLSISAIPRLTRAVPVSFACSPERPGAAVSAPNAPSTVDTVKTSWLRAACFPSYASRPSSAAPVGVGQRVVHCEELRRRRVARQPQRPGQRPPPGVDGPQGHVVVELAGDEHLVRRGLHLAEQFRGPVLAVQFGPEARLAERGAQRAGQVAFRQVPFGWVGLLGAADRIGEQQAGGRVEQTRRGQLVGHRAAPH